MKRTFGSDLIFAGLIGLGLATLITAGGCATHLLDGRYSSRAFFELVCPAGRLDDQVTVRPWAWIFSKIALLWGLTLFTLLSGAGLRFMEWLNDPENRFRRSETMPLPAPTSPGEFGKRVGTKTALPILLPTSVMIWADSTERDTWHKSLQRLLDAGRIDDAAARVEVDISRFDDPAGEACVIKSRDARIDWVDLVCEAIESDQSLSDEEGERCRFVNFELGSSPESMRNVYRFYHPAPPSNTDTKRAGRWFGLVEDKLYFDGLGSAAALEVAAGRQLQPQLGELLTTLGSLRFFQTVARHAADTGFPFPVRLVLSIFRLGGPEDYRRLRSEYWLTTDPAVSPIDDAIERRLVERRTQHGLKWTARIERSLAVLRKTYEEKGWVESRLIPESMAAEKARFRALEDQLLVSDPQYRVSPWQFDELSGRIRRAFQDELPRPVDLGLYR